MCMSENTPLQSVARTNRSHHLFACLLIGLIAALVLPTGIAFLAVAGYFVCCAVYHFAVSVLLAARKIETGRLSARSPLGQSFYALASAGCGAIALLPQGLSSGIGWLIGAATLLFLVAGSFVERKAACQSPSRSH